jgi:GNAT superfamily N-acetyltransferase
LFEKAADLLSPLDTDIMEFIENDPQPTLSHAEPVLAVRDVPESVAYWQDVLGFTDKWIWEPPHIGGVSWQGAAFIQFTQNPGLAAVSAGHSIWIRARNIDPLYALHLQKGAEIVVALRNEPWGFAQYTVRDINGYYVHFAAPVMARKPDPDKAAAATRLVERPLTLAEREHLFRSVGWLGSGDVVHEHAAEAVIYSTVAEVAQTGEAIGCAFLLGDNGSFYYIKDVIVHPAWQDKGIGTALVRQVTHWLKAHAPAKATAGLFTSENLAPFYRQFGFKQACGMYREVGKLTL